MPLRVDTERELRPPQERLAPIHTSIRAAGVDPLTAVCSFTKRSLPLGPWPSRARSPDSRDRRLACCPNHDTSPTVQAAVPPQQRLRATLELTSGGQGSSYMRMRCAGQGQSVGAVKGSVEERDP